MLISLSVSTKICRATSRMFNEKFAPEVMAGRLSRALLLHCRREVPLDPGRDRIAHLGQLPFEEMISAFDQYQLLRIRSSIHDAVECIHWTVSVVSAADEQLGLSARGKELVLVGTIEN